MSTMQRLEDMREAPQLPASYPAMMLLALLPGLFFDVMDPRALQVAQQSQARRQNCSSPAAARRQAV